MPLFRHLSDDAFLIFSRRHRFAYEAALLEVHDRFFATGIAFPTPREVTHVLYDLVARRPDLIEDIDPGDGLPELVSKGRRRLRFIDTGGENGDRALRFAAHLYQGLLRTGWLEEEEYGLKVTVDMPMGALLVVQRFASLKADVSQRFGGLIVHVKTSLEHVERLSERNTPKNRGDAAHALHTSRTNVEAFARGLRAILSDLRRIRKALLEAQGLRQKMETYFEEFIGELLLKDFQSILTFNHPYRFRDQIITSVRAISVDRALVGLVEEGYREQGLSPGAETADDLLVTEQAFETVGEMFERIAQFRRALESRLRNTVKYAEQGERGLGSRARDLVPRLEALLLRAEPGRYDRPTVPASVESVRSPWSDRHLAPHRQTPSSVQRRPLSGRPVDPVYLARKQLRAEYLMRINPSPAEVRAFLRRKVLPFQTQEARFIKIEDVDEFLAFYALRRYALSRAVPPEIAASFDVEANPVSDVHDCEWLRCPNFVVHHSRPEPCDAGRV
ncbi:MAG: DUF5716 family protein [Methylobacterium sp.]|uniref:Wadjet anti-phage system protein JetA family protein n=1 Tax=Methylobacterium sp. TaxID=409 RepID=UPI00271F7468|nr:Wadjet anti-phage system protein JetA family protein [Methylobacterium sp.]MDO9428671.1 DUF5716 family protein [Methylobacterium sp.]